MERAEEVLARVRAGATLTSDDIETLRQVLESYMHLTDLVGQQSTTIETLRRLLFGAKTERLPTKESPPDATPPSSTNDVEDAAPATTSNDEPPHRPGNGRNGHKEYKDSETTNVSHESLEHKGVYPGCDNGNGRSSRERAKISSRSFTS